MGSNVINGWDRRASIVSESVLGELPAPANVAAYAATFLSLITLDAGAVETGAIRPKQDRGLGNAMQDGWVEGRVEPMPFSVITSLKTRADADDAPRRHAEAMRYGEYAMDVLLRELIRLGARRERLRAKVFGGGAVLSNMTTLNIGDRNADFVLRYLREQGIAVAAQDLRGPHARRVCFLPATGKAVVRKLRTQAGVVQMIQREEQALMRQLAGDAAATATARATTGRPA